MTTPSNPRALRSGLFAGLIVLSSAVAAVGCTATIEPAGYAGEEVAYVDGPVNLEGAPHETFDGRDVYFVGGRWHFRDGNRWVAYNREPAELARRRGARRR